MSLGNQRPQINFDELLNAVSQQAANEVVSLDSAARQAAQAVSPAIAKKETKRFKVRRSADNLKDFTANRDTQLNQLDNELGNLGLEPERQDKIRNILGSLVQRETEANVAKTKDFVGNNKTLVSPQEREALFGNIKDVSGEEKTLSEQISQSPLGGALENLGTISEQGTVRGLKEVAGAFQTPKTLQSFLRQQIPALSGASPVLGTALNLATQTPVVDASASLAQRIDKTANDLANQEGTRQRKEFNPIASGIGEFAGAAAPFVAAEVLTAGGASGAIAAPLLRQGLRGSVNNPIARRILANTVAGATENVVGEALVNPGRQDLEAGSFNPQQFIQDLGIATAAGGVLGGSLEGLVNAPVLRKLAERQGRVVSRPQSAPRSIAQDKPNLTPKGNQARKQAQELARKLENPPQEVQSNQQIADIVGQQSSQNVDDLRRIFGEEPSSTPKPQDQVKQSQQPKPKKQTSEAIEGQNAQLQQKEPNLKVTESSPQSFANQRSLPKDTLAPVKENKLGTKVVKNPDGTERIARTLGDFKATDFQELARNPKRLNKLSEIKSDLDKNVEKEIDRIADISKQKKLIENSIAEASEALARKLEAKGIKPDEFQYKGLQFFAKRGKDTDAVNTKGQRILNRFENILFKKKLGERISKDEKLSLRAQPNIGKVSKAKTGAQNDINDLAEQLMSFKAELGPLQKDFNASKKRFIEEVAIKLDNGGRDHVFRNEAGDTALYIVRPTSRFQGPGKELLDARTKQLQQRADTRRVVPGRFNTLIKDAATGGSVTFKRLEKELAKGVDNAADATQVVDNALDNFKKPDEVSKQFSLGQLGLAVFDFDSAAIALRATKPIWEKHLNKTKHTKLQQGVQLIEPLIGRAESFATRLRKTNIEGFRDFINEYEQLTSRELLAEGYLRNNLSKKQADNIGKVLQENNFSQLKQMIEGGKSIDGIDSAEDFEMLKLFVSNRSKRANLIKDTLDKARKAKVPPGELRILEEFLRTESLSTRGTGQALVDTLTSAAYFKALWNNPKATTLALTDPVKKLIPEFGLGRFISSIWDIASPPVRNSPLFKAYNAGDAGNFLDSFRGAKESTFWSKIKDANIFEQATNLSQDMGLLASARRFNQQWAKRTGEKIDILKDFDGLSEASADFVLQHNAIASKLYGAGRGALYKTEIEGNTFLKPYLAFKSEPLRFQKRVTEWTEAIQAGSVRNASPEAKLAGQEAAQKLATDLTVTTLLGGSKALLGYGGSLGLAYGLLLKAAPPETEQQIIDTIDSAALGNIVLSKFLGVKTNIDFGEKLSNQLLERNSGESFSEWINRHVTSSESDLPIFNILNGYGRNVKKINEAIEAKNYSQAGIELLKAFSSVGSFVEKSFKKAKDQPMSVWIDNNGALLEKQKQVDFADLFAYGQNETNIKRAVQLQNKAKNEAVKNFNIEKRDKQYIVRNASRQQLKTFEELINLLHQDRFQIEAGLSPLLKKSKNEIRQEILKKAFTARRNELKKGAKALPVGTPERLARLPVSKIKGEIAVQASSNKQKAFNQLRQAMRQDITQQKRTQLRNLGRELNLGI